MPFFTNGMNVVTVIPLERGVWTETLTYFSSRDIAIGAIVAVPLRLKTIPALVVKIANVAGEKALIRSSRIGMRKVLKVLCASVVTDTLLKATQESARFYATTTGSVLASIFPITLLPKIGELKTTEQREPKENIRKVIQILQTDDEDRFTQYRSLIRESFRHGQSILFLVPTIQEVETASVLLSKGIDDYTLSLHSEKKPKELLKAVQRMQQAEHPLLLIATPGFLGLTLPQVGTIIVERENAPSYKQLVRPFIDFRFFAQSFARNAKIRLILGDLLLSTETHYRYQTHVVDELAIPKWRITTKAKATLVDMKEYKPDIKGKVPSLSNELSAMLSTARAASERTFIFSARKGLAPTTLCGDCGSILLCDNCKHPVVLHKTTGHKRFYLCHRCGTKMDPGLRCRVCTSWKLTTYGVGTELIEEALRLRFPNLTILRLDRESTQDRKQALHTVETFYAAPGSVLVGTELALPFLTRPIHSVAAASLDALFSIPDFRVHERIAYLLYKLRSLADHAFLLQTRFPDSPVIQTVLEGNVRGLIDNELEIRKALHFPPFSVPLKITWHGKPNVLEGAMQELAENLKPAILDIFPALERYPNGKTGLSGILKIGTNTWPDERILAILQTLPRAAEINVDPVSVA